MATAHDVAAYILSRLGPTSAMKLQKLVYYSQSWHLVWDDRPLFPERIEAWANGPVVPDLYDRHRGQFEVTVIEGGDPDRLSPGERETVDIVLGAYGGLDGRKLSHLTHAESPWRDARHGLAPTARSNAMITEAALVEYYGALDAAEDATSVGDLRWEGWDSPAPTAI
ncbi:Panacea domain-containing protein [Actinoplanes derwentensis]|uniref:Uncharacterized phage-associated protein n=1 Tax=Actinoplanes derwentensis TaxID=113562 RepID=A0A1H1R652_9ACTN|nr:type II toxin-antitoxin system antitoxin SocA domain-containing protein [Actinoplanes derwentensis]GID88026.1 hypothetical protein Ade03nite_69500 [Actinoplanes derwentensis]SDS31221.1 Uncharacterized phage-associated protein [Actinoplanes derwentensis]